jgi:Do/DeqQ family serine protease
MNTHPFPHKGPVAVMALVTLLLLAAAPPRAQARTPDGTQLLDAIETVLVDLADRVQKGVVSISPTDEYAHALSAAPDLPDPGAPDMPHGMPPHGGIAPPDDDDTPGNGSGVVLDNEGHVVTNAHVVGTADEMEVRLTSGHKYLAKVVGKDPDTDLAVLQLVRDPDDTGPLPVLPLGDSDAVRPGQWTMAVGSPFGLERTVTVGIVSAVGREGVNLTQYENFIQTDASINPGNSGGPLFNIKGEVIGINTAIMSYAQGIGFAIPSNMVRDISAQLIESGHVERGWLGVGIQEINDDLAQTFSVPEGSGVLVNDVFPGHPADQNGIRPGDIIVALNGRPVTSPNTLARLVAALTPDSVARLTYLREGQRKNVEITLGRRERPVPTSAPPPAQPRTHRELGMDLQTLTPELAQEMNLTGAGVLVTDVESGGVAHIKGIRKGDVIREVNRRPVTEVDQVNAILASRAPGARILLRVTRGDAARYVVLAPGGG